jgi:hypothetical protein
MRFMPRPLRFATACLLLALLTTFHVAPAAAGLVPSQTTQATGIACLRDADLITVQRALENRLVQQKLEDYGVTPDQVQQRLGQMTDSELHTLASASAGLPTGADDAVGLLIGLLIVVLLVIVIMKLLNKQIVVK